MIFLRRIRNPGTVAVALLILGPLAQVTFRAPSAAEWAELMPLIAESLLLDAAVAGGRVIAVGERGHVLVSNDQGRSWTQVEAPTRSTLTAVTAGDQRHLWQATLGPEAVCFTTHPGSYDDSSVGY